MPSVHHSHGRAALAIVMWLFSWSFLVLALSNEDEPWPWGGVAIYTSVTAMTATLWWMVGIATDRVIEHLCSEVKDVRQELDALPELLADAVANALSVSRLN